MHSINIARTIRMAQLHGHERILVDLRPMFVDRRRNRGRLQQGTHFAQTPHALPFCVVDLQTEAALQARLQLHSPQAVDVQVL
jgi:hypothetical protein